MCSLDSPGMMIRVHISLMPSILVGMSSIKILYKPQSDHRRAVEEYVQEFVRRGYNGLQLIDADSGEGSHLAELYGIMDRPAVLALDNEGRLLASWQGSQLPLYDELLAYIV